MRDLVAMLELTVLPRIAATHGSGLNAQGFHNDRKKVVFQGHRAAGTRAEAAASDFTHARSAEG